MTTGGGISADAPASDGRALLTAPLALIACAACLPPETRGESLAGCAILIAIAVLGTGVARGHLRAAGALGLACVLAVGTTLVASAPGSAVEPVTWLVLALAVGLAVATMPAAVRASSTVPAVVALAGAVAAVHGLYQVSYGFDATLAALAGGADVPDRDAIVARLSSGRAIAAFPTPAALGGFLAIALAVTAAAARAARGRARAWLSIAAAVQLAGLAATRSVTAVVSLVAALALAAGVAFARGSRARGAGPARGPVVAVAAIAGVAIVLVAVVVGSRGSELRAGAVEHPLALRAGNMRIAAEMIAERPFTGFGPGGYGEAYARFRGAADNESRHAHDLPLEWLAEYGVFLGAAMTAGFFVLFLGPLFRRQDDEPRWGRGVAVGLAAFAIHNLADFTATLPSLLWIAATLRGFVAGEPVAVPGHPSRAPRVAVAGAVAVACVAALVGVGAGVAWNARVEARYARAAGDPAGAESAFARAVRWAPWHPDGVAALAVRAGEPGSARADERTELWGRAHRLAPERAATWAIRAAWRERVGDLSGAFSDWMAASASYPGKPEYRARAERLRSVLER